MKREPRLLTDDEIADFVDEFPGRKKEGEFQPSEGVVHCTCELCGQMFVAARGISYDNMNTQFCEDCDEDSPIEFI